MDAKRKRRIRILSGVALVLLAILTVVGVWVLLTNPGLILAYVLCGLGILAGGWLMFRLPGNRAWWGTALTIVSGVALVGVTWGWISNAWGGGRLIAVAALVLGYLATTGAIVREYWKGKREAVQVKQPASRRVVLIVNPKSGNGRAIKAGIPEIARELGIETIVMEPGQNMIQLAKDAAKSGVDVLGVSGGDGSLGAVAKVAMDHNLPLVVLPGGTRCHFARDIGLDPLRIADALHAFEGVERRVDVAVIGERVLLNNASFGLYAKIISSEAYRDHKVEESRRVARELISSETPSYPLRFTDGDGQEWQQAAQVLVGVNRYETMNLGELGQRKAMDGGVLHVIAVRALNAATMTQLLGKWDFDAASGGNVKAWETREFTIAGTEARMMAGVDGESEEVMSPVHLRILPGALRLMVPPEGVRGRPVKALSRKAAGNLWSVLRGHGLD